MSYKLTSGSSVIRLADGATIPSDPKNADWRAYQEWLAADPGNVPAAAGSPAESKAMKIAQARVVFAQKLALGVAHGGHVYQLDAESQMNITAMGSTAASVLAGAAGATWPGDFAFRAADNGMVAMTAADMFALAQAARDRVWALRTRMWQLIDAVAAAADQAALDAIDVAAGWPA